MDTTDKINLPSPDLDATMKYTPVEPVHNLLFTTGPLAGEQFPIGKGITLGRGESANIRIKDPQISGVHLWIGQEGGEIVLRDKQSTNGTFLNDKLDQPITEIILNDGDVVNVGAHSDVAFKLVKAVQPAVVTPPAQPPLATPPPPPAPPVQKPVVAAPPFPPAAKPVKDAWFVVRAGQEHGPYTKDLMRQYLAAGNLAADDQVRHGDEKTLASLASVLSMSTPGGAASAGSQDSKNLALMMWIGTLFFGFLPGLIFYLVKKDDPYIQDQSKEALNWSITTVIGYIAGFILTFVVIGIFVFLILGICHLVFCIMGAVAVSNGKTFRVPFAIRLMK
jgi:uncharacterized Tic20 family protein